jgi:hypothetical protein
VLWRRAWFGDVLGNVLGGMFSQTFGVCHDSRDFSTHADKGEVFLLIDDASSGIDNASHPIVDAKCKPMTIKNPPKHTHNRPAAGQLQAPKHR